MIQPPARLGEGESAGRRPGGSAAEAGKARLPALRAGGLRPDPASSTNSKNPAKTKLTPSPCAGGETIALIVNQINILVDN